MRIRKRDDEGCIVLDLEGSLDAQSVGRVLPLFREVLGAGDGAPILVDMRGVDRMDAAGLAALAMLYRGARATGRAIGVHGLGDLPKQLLSLAGLRPDDGTPREPSEARAGVNRPLAGG